MATIFAGFEDVDPLDLLEAVVDTYDFTLPGAAGGTLGKDLVGKVAEGIAARSAQAKDPDGEPWTANEDRYARYKAARYSVHQPGELGGQMLSLLSLVGRPKTTPDRIEMVYGTDTQPGPNARNGVPLKDHEREATDVKKGQYFTDSGRRFYEFDEEIMDQCTEVAQDSLDEWLKAAGF